MNSKQMRYITRNPRALMEFQTTGRLPRMKRLDSPLIRLLEQYTPRQRMQMRGVRLHPDLGYQTGMQFHTGEQLYRWVKPSAEVLECENIPAESYRNKRFNRELTEDDLRKHCASLPEGGR
ncbi:MAG: hypothetical protein PHT38_01125 [Halothiobacillus sp.]|nr:hypothetical protein [Halothiobacillus sp.]